MIAAWIEAGQVTVRQRPVPRGLALIRMTTAGNCSRLRKAGKL